MSVLVAIGYLDETTASKAASQARELARDSIIGPDAMAVIVRDSDGDLHVETHHHSADGRETWGMFWSILFGFLFFVPMLGTSAGAGLKALFTKVEQSGVDEDFQIRAREMLEPRTSVVFLIIDQATWDKTARRLAKFGGTVLKSSLSENGERELQYELNGAAAA